MCGICGIYDYNEERPVDKDILAKMNRRLVHRGPESEGYYIKENIGLAHRRLKIIDVETGNQPMSNENGSIWIVFNGMIYNYIELRENLEKKGHRFKTKSDTEVIIHLYEEHGEECLRYLRGMFAFAIWDEKSEKLFLAKDRVGKKPLVYMELNGKFIFASEIKALLEFPKYRIDIDWFGVSLFFAYEYWIPWPYSIFKGIKKLEPATYLIVYKDGRVKKKRYWFPNFLAKSSRKEEDLIEEFYHLIDESVKLRLRSDVPLGALLSGGVDSSSVIAITKEYIPEVSTFSLGFGDGGKVDEEFIRAKEISSKFKTNHHEVIFTSEHLRYLPIMIFNHDEPFANITSLYIWFLTKFIKESGTTVVLSGNGPDEVFLGYSSGYQLKIQDIIYKAIQIFPKEIFSILPNGSLKEKILRRYLPYSKMLSSGIEKRFNDNISGLFNSEIRQFQYEGVGNLLEKIYLESRADNLLDGYSYLALMLTYAHGLTAHTDASAMANAIEIRSPFLDHKIIEFAASLPINMKVKGFSEKGCKYIVKKTMERKVPKEILYAKKFGFGYNISWPALLLRKYGAQTKQFLLEGEWIKNRLLRKDYVERLFACSNRELAKNGMQVLRLLTLEIWFRIYMLNKKVEDINIFKKTYGTD